MIENWNYALEITRKLGCVVISMQGSDLWKGKNKKLILGIVWQLMRAYTYSLLVRAAAGSGGEKALSDQDVVAWYNAKMDNDQRKIIRNFRDKRIRDSKGFWKILQSIAESTGNPLSKRLDDYGENSSDNGSEYEG